MFGLISKKRLTKEIVELYERASDDYFNSPPSENSFHYCCGNHNALNYLSYVFNLGITEIIKDNNHQKFFKKYWQAPKEHVESKWIPVSERLPEDDNYYLVTLMPVEAPNECFVDKCRFFKDEWYQVFLTAISEKYIRVVAWRPLPKPYEVEE